MLVRVQVGIEQGLTPPRPTSVMVLPQVQSAATLAQPAVKLVACWNMYEDGQLDGNVVLLVSQLPMS